MSTSVNGGARDYALIEPTNDRLKYPHMLAMVARIYQAIIKLGFWATEEASMSLI